MNFYWIARAVDQSEVEPFLRDAGPWSELPAQVAISTWSPVSSTRLRSLLRPGPPRAVTWTPVVLPPGAYYHEDQSYIDAVAQIVDGELAGLVSRLCEEPYQGYDCSPERVEAELRELREFARHAVAVNKPVITKFGD
jgi:hypothetical protein